MPGTVFAPVAPPPAAVAAPPTAPAAAPPPLVLAPAAIAALPFTVDLPAGYTITTGRPGPDFQEYSIRRDGRSMVMVYVGPSSQFPIYDGETVEVGGRTSIVTTYGGQRHAVEHLFQRPNAPREIHVWVASVDDADQAAAEAVAQSVDAK